MSRQQTFAPDEPEEPKIAPGKKGKPWCLWHQLGWKGQGGWWRFGRYRTRAEAEKVMRQKIRLHSAGKYYRWGEDNTRIMREDEGKPE